MFEEFWTVYPKKVYKEEARGLFEKLDEPKQKLIIGDVINRSMNHSQWKDKKYVPSPARYLRRELWNDEIIIYDTREQKQLKNDTGSPLSRLWIMLEQLYGKPWINKYGETAPKIWRYTLTDLTLVDCGKIIKYLATETESYEGALPNVTKINRIRRIGTDQGTYIGLPKPVADKNIVSSEINKMFDMLRAV